MNWNAFGNALRKSGKFALKLAGIGLGIWISLVLADILTFYYAYVSSHSVLLDRGMSEYGSKIVAIVFAAIFMLTVHRSVWYMIKRDHQRWVLLVTGGILAWFVIMYVVSSPYSNSSFNPFSGEPQAKYYRDGGGQIVKMPLGAKTGPEGQPLQLIDRKTAEEYKAQAALVTPAQKSETVKSVRSSNLTLLRTIEILVTNEWSERVPIPPGQRMRTDRLDPNVAYEGRGPNTSMPISVPVGLEASGKRIQIPDGDWIQYRVTDEGKQVKLRINFFPY